ncbi:hypothetical protein HDU98_008670 [Podochytrium sp. JEL0797]|nr:hypothetical protein HDU98_008670 [Podochytrium sp. JEL0797]
MRSVSLPAEGILGGPCGAELAAGVSFEQPAVVQSSSVPVAGNTGVEADAEDEWRSVFVLAMEQVSRHNPSPFVVKCLNKWQDVGRSYFLAELFDSGIAAPSNNPPVWIPNWYGPRSLIVPIEIGSSDAFDAISSQIDDSFDQGRDGFLPPQEVKDNL